MPCRGVQDRVRFGARQGPATPTPQRNCCAVAHLLALCRRPLPVPSLDDVLLIVAQLAELGVAVQLDLLLGHASIPGGGRGGAPAAAAAGGRRSAKEQGGAGDGAHRPWTQAWAPGGRIAVWGARAQRTCAGCCRRPSLPPPAFSHPCSSTSRRPQPAEAYWSRLPTHRHAHTHTRSTTTKFTTTTATAAAAATAIATWLRPFCLSAVRSHGARRVTTTMAHGSPLPLLLQLP